MIDGADKEVRAGSARILRGYIAGERAARLKGHFDRGNVARQDSSSNRYDPKYAASDFGTLLSVRKILLLKAF